MKSVLLLLISLLLLLGLSTPMSYATGTDPSATSVANAQVPVAATSVDSITGKRYKPEGETGKAFSEESKKTRKTSSYKSWKRKLPFWPRKLFLLFELTIFIIAGILVGQILEVSGSMRFLSIFTYPITALGNIRRETAPAFLMAFQSGAVANGMLVAQRDTGTINNRELYTSIFVVSALSLFAHLPTFIVPLGAAFGWEATIALFSVRFLAIAIQIVTTLLVSRFIVTRLFPGFSASTTIQPAQEVRQPRQRSGSFWGTVWNRASKTLKRLLKMLIPTYLGMAALEYYGFFKWLGGAMPGLFSFSFLPAESVAIIPAQALSLYNGAIAAANFIDAGDISIKQAVVIILFGSMVTAPVRTLRRALPAYVAILGARSGTTMSVLTQVVRTIFTLLCTLALMWYWQ